MKKEVDVFIKKEEEKKQEEITEVSLRLKRIFAFLDRKIKYYRRCDHKESKEELIENREKLFKIAQEIDLRDLWILYYIRFTDGLGRMKALKLLKELYEAHRSFQEKITKP